MIYEARLLGFYREEGAFVLNQQTKGECAGMIFYELSIPFIWNRGSVNQEGENKEVCEHVYFYKT